MAWGYGVGVKLLLEEVLRGFHGCLLVRDFLVAGIFFKDWGAGKSEELGLGEELFNGSVVLTELRAVTFVENKDDAFIAQRL